MDLKTRFKASLVLGGAGDALGYKNGAYEFCRSGKIINDDVDSLPGGLHGLKINSKDWMVSDDTVMTIATAEGLVDDWLTQESLYLKIAAHYKDCMHDMSGRAPGNTCMMGTRQMRPKVPKGYVISFNPRGGGCGAAMRAAPIGLFYHCPDQIHQLVAVSVESGRMTHNHPTGYLGSLAAALFVSYAIQQKPLIEWGAGLMDTLGIALEYVRSVGRDVHENEEHWSYFTDQWQKYLKLRGIEDGKSQPKFPEQFGPVERDAFYKSVSFAGWGGSSGHDAPMIAYDALLGCGGSWEELCRRGMFHGGDCDSTGIIAGTCWGAMYGFHTVPEGHYKKLEYLKRLEDLAKSLYKKCGASEVAIQSTTNEISGDTKQSTTDETIDTIDDTTDTTGKDDTADKADTTGETTGEDIEEHK